MTENLNLKISVDTTEVDRSVKKIKQSIKEVGKDSGKIGDVSSVTSESMRELKNQMESIRNLQFADMIIDHFDGIKKSVTGLTGGVKSFSKNLKTAVDAWAYGFNFKKWAKENNDPLDTIKDKIEVIGVMSKEAADITKQSFKRMGNNIKQFGSDVKAALNSTIAQIGILVASVASMVAIIRNGFSVSAQAKSMNVLAQQAGMSAEAYQRWAFVLGQVGLQVDDMIGAQQTLLEAQIDVRNQEEDIIAAFEKLGITQEEVMNMNQQQLFERTVEGLQGVENATEKATIAYKLLSEDSKNLAPLLNLNNEQVKTLANNFNTLNGAMSAGLIKSSNRLQASLGNLRTAWQGLRNTLAELVLPILNTVVNALAKAIVWVNLFVRTLFGLDMAGSASSNVDGATSSMGGYADSVENATTAVQKLKRIVMGFDELNILTDPNSGGSGSEDEGIKDYTGGFGAGSTESLFNSEALNLEKVHKFFDTWKTRIQDFGPIALVGIGTLGCILSLLGGNWAAAIFFAGMAGIGFMAGESNGAWDKWRSKLEEINLGFVPICMVGIGAVGAVIALVTGNIPAAVGLAALAGLGLALGGGNDWSKFMSDYKGTMTKFVTLSMVGAGAIGCVLALILGNVPAAIFFGAMAGIGLANIGTGGKFFETAIDGVKKIFNGFIGWFENKLKPIFTTDFWKEKWSTIKAGFDAKIEPIKSAMVTAWGGIKNWYDSSVAPIFTKQYWLDKFDTIRHGANEKLGAAKTAMSNQWNQVKDWFGSAVAPKFTKQYWLDKFDAVRHGANEKIGAAKTAITNQWNKTKEWFSKSVAPKFTKSYWLTKFDTIRHGANEKVAAAKTAIQSQWSSLKKWYDKSVAPKFTKTYWTGKFNTIKDGAKAAFNGIISIVETAINRIIARMNTLSWSIPDWVPKVGGKKFGFNFKSVSIPRLAEGGIAMRSTLANIGENGKEAVLPLENNTGWMDMLADRIAARQQAPTKVVLKVGEKELGWASIKGINQITKQTGELQLQL